MQSFLIISSDPDFIKSKIDNLKKVFSVSLYNYHEINPSPAIGIAEIRQLISVVSRKSYDGGNKLIYIADFDKATTEASNSILKILEEPPPGTYIALSCANPNNLLPTIISRCLIITDHKKIVNRDQKETERITGLINTIISSGPGKRLQISIETAKTKDTSKEILDHMLHILENSLGSEKPDINLSKLEIARLIQKISAASSYLDKNVNFKAVTDILFLGFPAKTPNKSR